MKHDAAAAIKRATRRFRCRTCGASVRARWNILRGERTIEEHGTATVRCPRSGRLVEVTLLDERAEMARIADRLAAR